MNLLSFHERRDRYVNTYIYNLYVCSIWQSSSPGFKRSLGTDKDPVFTDLSTVHFNWPGPEWTDLHSLTGFDCGWDRIAACRGTGIISSRELAAIQITKELTEYLYTDTLIGLPTHCRSEALFFRGYFKDNSRL